jgi:hypothetical protein
MANILGIQTLDNATILLVDANPAAGAGIEAGRFFVLGARVVSGTGTLGQVIRTVFTPKGYFK